MSVSFLLPDLGEGIHEAQVIAVAVKEGDTVAEDQVLLEVETDKAAVEIPSPQAGLIEQAHVRVGQIIHVGDALVTFAGEAAEGEPAEPAVQQNEAVSTPAASGSCLAPAPPDSEHASRTSTGTLEQEPPAPAKTHEGPVPASPAVRRLAREQGIELRTVRATGPNGRITRDDLERHLKASAEVGVGPASAEGGAATPEAAPAAVAAPGATTSGQKIPHGEPGTDRWGPIVRQQLTQIRKTIAAQMVSSYTQIPHVLQADTADVTALDEFRRECRRNGLPGSEKLTLTPFVVKALVNALKRHPKFNSSFDSGAGELIFKQYYNVGMAVDTPRGLVVPVVRQADLKSVLELAREYAELAERMRTGKFTLEELRGGTFTITNVGALGGTFFTPIINHPEVAILGTGRAEPAPVARDGKVVVRTMLPLCLSFDHRACDGAEAARFLNDIKAQLENPISLAL
jgi:pyruvate dehydrogenase E2 component (dihydrolipoamide acetyltransferase)